MALLLAVDASHWPGLAIENLTFPVKSPRRACGQIAIDQRRGYIYCNKFELIGLRPD
jgi:hypothetical protein